MAKQKAEGVAHGKKLPRAVHDQEDPCAAPKSTLLGRLIAKLLHGGGDTGPTRSTRPILEPLEPRLLLSGTPPLPEPSFPGSITYSAAGQSAAVHATLELVDTGAANLTLELGSGA